MALVQRTEWPASTTARPSAIARWVFPTPGAPKIRTFSACARKRLVASSRTSPLIDGRLEFDIEVVERLHGREVRDLQIHRGARALFGLDLLAEHAIEKSRYVGSVRAASLDVMEGADVRVVQAGDGLGFPVEPLLQIWVRGNVLGEHLDRHGAVQAGIAGL